MHTGLEVILVPGYILHMWNDQMSGSKAGNTWKGFQNNKYKIDTKGTELLPTMTHSYDLWPWEVHKSKQIGLNWKDIFYLSTSQKVLHIHARNFTQLIVTPNMVCCDSSVLIRQIATEL